MHTSRKHIFSLAQITNGLSLRVLTNTLKPKGRSL